MRVLLASVAALAAVAGSANAFVATTSTTARGTTTFRASTTEECSTTACEIPSGFGDDTPSLVGVKDGANALRSAVVTNSAGDFVRIDDAISATSAGTNAPQVLIYLRHMG